MQVFVIDYFPFFFHYAYCQKKYHNNIYYVLIDDNKRIIIINKIKLVEFIEPIIREFREF